MTIKLCNITYTNCPNTFLFNVAKEEIGDTIQSHRIVPF